MPDSSPQSRCSEPSGPEQRRATPFCQGEQGHARLQFIYRGDGQRLRVSAIADMPETTRLAGTIEKWGPDIKAFLELGITKCQS